MPPTSESDLDALITEIQSGISGVLGDRLVGIYLYGSLVTGDFLAGVSDIDLLAATSCHLDEGDLAPLRAMHAGLVGRYPAWDDRLMNWYLIRTGGVTLAGPPPEAIIPPITLDEFIASVRAHARDWSDWVERMTSRNEQSYVILTLCRALRLCLTGDHVSKIAAAEWAKARFPNDAALIDAALRWRTERAAPGDARTLPETRRFARMVQAEIAATGS